MFFATITVSLSLNDLVSPLGGVTDAIHYHNLLPKARSNVVCISLLRPEQGYFRLLEAEISLFRT